VLSRDTLPSPSPRESELRLSPVQEVLVPGALTSRDILVLVAESDKEIAVSVVSVLPRVDLKTLKSNSRPGAIPELALQISRVGKTTPTENNVECTCADSPDNWLPVKCVIA
jgi:hypothetical protein